VIVLLDKDLDLEPIGDLRLGCACGAHLGMLALALGFMFWMLNFGTIFSQEPNFEMVLNHDLMCCSR